MSIKMPITEVRQVQGDELLAISHQLAGYAFEPTPPMPDREKWHKMLEQLASAVQLALFENGKPMALAAFSPMTQHLRGQLYPVGGVWAVATHPAARRKGYSRQVLTRLYSAMQAADMPLSCLYPFRESFYERLGYVNLLGAHKITFSPQNLVPLLKKDLHGHVDLLPISEGFDIYRAYLESQQLKTHGMALFDRTTAEHVRQENAHWLAMAYADNRPVGAMLYQIKGEEDNFRMLVQRFFYTNSQGRYLLLEWCARHADQAKEVEIMCLPPFELPETWLADLQVQVSLLEPPMARVIDVNKLDGLQIGEGSFTAQILDEHCPWNNGCFLFASVEGKLKVSPATRADCELTIQALTTLVYGTHTPDSFVIRGWGNPSPTLQATLSAMFTPKMPYLHEVY